MIFSAYINDYYFAILGIRTGVFIYIILNIIVLILQIHILSIYSLYLVFFITGLILTGSRTANNLYFAEKYKGNISDVVYITNSRVLFALFNIIISKFIMNPKDLKTDRVRNFEVFPKEVG